MTKKQKDEFMEWFVAQHGKRPSEKPSFDLRSEWINARDLAERTRSLYEQCERYDAQLTSAKYAKNAFSGK